MALIWNCLLGLVIASATVEFDSTDRYFGIPLKRKPSSITQAQGHGHVHSFRFDLWIPDLVFEKHSEVKLKVCHRSTEHSRRQANIPYTQHHTALPKHKLLTLFKKPLSWSGPGLATSAACLMSCKQPVSGALTRSEDIAADLEEDGGTSWRRPTTSGPLWP